MKTIIHILAVYFLIFAVPASPLSARDLRGIQEEGVLRHLGVPYANFVTGDGQGLDVEIMQLFAASIGVRYEYVKTDWSGVIGDLTGKKVSPDGDNVKITGEVEIRGDVIANGLTILPWRQKVVDYSDPTFPTQVWLIAQSQSTLHPITPGDSIEADIAATKKLLTGKAVIGKAKTCLDPSLYFLEDVNATTEYFEGTLNELAPAVMEDPTKATLLDVPDTLVALAKWPGQIKILGPISPEQEMGAGFRKDSAALRQAFDSFYKKLREDGTYQTLVQKYYPDAFDFFPEFFKTR